MTPFSNPAPLFAERQKFTQAWLWVLILLPAVIILPLALLAPKPPGIQGLLATLIVSLALGISIAIFGFAVLATVVTPAELHLRFTPFFVDKHIPLADIVRFTPMSYTVWQAGYGIHRSRYGWVYNTSGKEGIQIELRDGKRLLIGTQRPREFAAALQQAGVRPS